MGPIEAKFLIFPFVKLKKQANSGTKGKMSFFLLHSLKRVQTVVQKDECAKGNIYVMPKVTFFSPFVRKRHGKS